MRTGFSGVVLVAAIFVLLVLSAARTYLVSAEPNAQAPSTPTDEPIKPPYVFPTPVFIPKYPDEPPTPRPTPAATRTPGPPPREQTYTVQAGDSPWTISQKMYGDGTKYRLIMEANDLADQARLRVGTVLKIPQVSGTAQVATATPSPPLPTAASPGLAASILPTSVPSTPVLLATRTPTATVSSPASALVNALPLAINVTGSLLLATALLSAVLAILLYARVRRIGKVGSLKRTIRFRQ